MLLTSRGFVRGYWRVGVMVAEKPRAIVVLFARSRSPVVLVVVLIVCTLILGRRVIFMRRRGIRVDTESYLLVVVISGL